MSFFKNCKTCSPCELILICTREKRACMVSWVKRVFVKSVLENAEWILWFERQCLYKKLYTLCGVDPHTHIFLCSWDYMWKLTIYSPFFSYLWRFEEDIILFWQVCVLSVSLFLSFEIGLRDTWIPHWSLGIQVKVKEMWVSPFQLEIGILENCWSGYI